LVAQQKPKFVEFLQSVRYLEAEPAMPAGHPDIGALPVSTPTGPAAGTPQWNVPADWTPAAAGQFLAAKFTVAGGKATVNVSTSPSDGGGLAANVNRWRKQLGLGELTGDELAKSVSTAGTVSLVEMNGTKAALVGAIVTQPGQTWFYKLMGDPAAVAAQKDAFRKFVEDAKY
jgi:hypothetical protein